MPSPCRFAVLVLGGVLAAGVADAAEPPEEATADRVREAVINARLFLFNKQSWDGTWEKAGGYGAQRHPGGVTSLALLALLEIGTKPDDFTVSKGLDYLRQLRPDQTYEMTLQTRVLCRADPKKNAELIQRNVDQLLQGALRKNDRLLGWGYPVRLKDGAFVRVDNSNTEYAVLALHAASQAGARIPEQAWKDIRARYLRMQNPDGGWPYPPSFPEKSTLSMTCAGLCTLLITAKELRLKDDEDLRHVRKAVDYLTRHFDLAQKSYEYDLLATLAHVHRLADKELPAEQREALRDCYRKGMDFLLKEQAADGSWRGDSGLIGTPVVRTSFGLLFLAEMRRKP
jgi:hypothetical protein